MEIQEVKTIEEARAVTEFLSSKDAFPITLSDGEYKVIREHPLNSINEPHSCYWFAKTDEGKVVAAGGVYENEIQLGGYILDYFAVSEKYRRLNLGSQLLQEAEKFIKANQGRYIDIDTGDSDNFAGARAFYESNGYKAVSHLPFYYSEENGRIDYYKLFV